MLSWLIVSAAVFFLKLGMNSALNVICHLHDKLGSDLSYAGGTREKLGILLA